MSKNKKKRKDRSKGGRPEYQPTLAEREKVAAAAGGGMSHEEIAIGLGIARGTLEKHFAFELSQGAYAKRLEVLAAMHKTALNGNVSAQKAYIGMNPALAAPPPPKVSAPAKPAKKGKKEEQADAAKEALHSPEWAGLLNPHAKLN